MSGDDAGIVWPEPYWVVLTVAGGKFFLDDASGTVLLRRLVDGKEGVVSAIDFVDWMPFVIPLRMIASLNKSGHEAQWRAHMWNVKEAAMQKAFNERAPMPQVGGDGEAESWR